LRHMQKLRLEIQHNIIHKEKLKDIGELLLLEMLNTQVLKTNKEELYQLLKRLDPHVLSSLRQNHSLGSLF